MSFVNYHKKNSLSLCDTPSILVRFGGRFVLFGVLFQKSAILVGQLVPFEHIGTVFGGTKQRLLVPPFVDIGVVTGQQHLRHRSPLPLGGTGVLRIFQKPGKWLSSSKHASSDSTPGTIREMQSTKTSAGNSPPVST